MAAGGSFKNFVPRPPATDTKSGNEVQSIRFSNILLNAFANISTFYDNETSDFQKYAILCGHIEEKPSSNSAVITHLCFPDQTSESFSVGTQNGLRHAEKLIERNFLQSFGIITIHPLRGKKMSLRNFDINLLAHFQETFPHAIALVVDPNYNGKATYATYTLTSAGLKSVLRCKDESLNILHNQPLSLTIKGSSLAVKDDSNIFKEALHSSTKPLPDLVKRQSHTWVKLHSSANIKTETETSFGSTKIDKDPHFHPKPFVERRSDHFNAVFVQPPNSARSELGTAKHNIPPHKDTEIANFAPSLTAQNEVESADQESKHATRKRSLSYQDNEESIFCKNFNTCKHAIERIRSHESFLVSKGIVSQGRMALMALEKSILDMVATEQISSGVHYHLCLDADGDSLVTRYFEAGCLRGMMENFNQILGDRTNSLEYKIFTDIDVEKRTTMLTKRQKSIKEKRSEITGTASKAKYNRTKRYDQLQSQIQRQWQSLLEALTESGVPIKTAVLSTMKENARPSSSKDHYLQVYGYDTEQVNRCLLEHRTLGDVSACRKETNYLFKPQDFSSVQDQTDFLNEIPNLHTMTSHTSYERNLCIQIRKRYHPVSHRNRLLFYFDSDYLAFKSEVQKMTTYLTGSCEVTKHKRLKKEHSRRIFSKESAVQANDFLASENAAFIRSESMACTENSKPFLYFLHQLLSTRCVYWRHHSDEYDVIIMNAYDIETCTIVRSSFEHVFIERYQSDYQIRCTCKAYRYLLQHVASDVIDCKAVDSITCMHSRIIHEFIMPSYDILQSPVEHKSRILNVFGQAFQNRNSGKIFKATPEEDNDNCGTIKYSVLSAEKDFAFVHLCGDGSFISCTSGSCNIQMGFTSRKRSKALITIDKVPGLCPHLQEMKENSTMWLKECPPLEENTDGNTDETWNRNAIEHNALNDLEVNRAIDTDFEAEIEVTEMDKKQDNLWIDQNGLWKFNSISMHKPSKPNTQMYLRNIQRRLLIHATGNKDRNGVIVDHRLFDKNPPTKCPCGVGYHKVEVPDGINLVYQYGETVTRLFTRHGPVDSRVFSWRCRNGNCLEPYTGEKHGIWFKSKQTAISDEVMYDFESRLFEQNIKYNFSSFVFEMNKQYKSNGCSENGFMSRGTFVDLAFAWMAALQIDFRSHIDPFCGYNPDMLACDGTHIGPALRNLHIEPIEKPDPLLPPVLVDSKKFNRNFIPGSGEIAKRARQFLTQLVASFEVKGNLSDMSNDLETKDDLDNFLGQIPVEFHRAIECLIDDTLPKPMAVSLVRLLKLLSNNHSLLTVIPYDEVDNYFEYMISLLREETRATGLSKIKTTFGLEIHDLLSTSVETEFFDVATDVIAAIAKEVEKFYGRYEDIQAREIPDTYYPSKGVAYYFSRTGNAVRNVPEFMIKETSQAKNTNQSTTKCQKHYPKISRGGFSSIFLWLCPKHGHCYGFHLIHNSEGRKDPFSSLYKYKATAPKCIYYDFACGLSEYSLSRAPAFFRSTRILHDSFHSYNHICGNCFKASRFPSIVANSEICEQFNSYLQRIKYSSTHLSQERFCFLMQYAIYKWNGMRTETCEKRLEMLVKCSK